MFYDIEKLNELEKVVSDNLSTADCLNNSTDIKAVSYTHLTLPTIVDV